MVLCLASALLLVLGNPPSVWLRAKSSLSISNCSSAPPAWFIRKEGRWQLRVAITGSSFQCVIYSISPALLLFSVLHETASYRPGLVESQLYWLLLDGSAKGIRGGKLDAATQEAAEYLSFLSLFRSISAR